MKRLILTILAMIVWVLPAFVIGAVLTGYTPRAYAVLAPSDTLILAGERVTAQESAEMYRPVVLDSPTHRPPDLVALWYVVVAPVDDGVTIIYYPGWADEKHPNPVVDVLYRGYRQAVYGSAQDMEYIEVTVDQSSGEVERVQFETAPEGEFDRSYTEHLAATLTRQQGSFTLRVVDRGGNVITPSTPLPDAGWAPGSPLSFYVQTWNHLYELEPPAWQVEPLDMPLRFLDDATYRQLKMSWRSHGSVYTPKNSLTRVLAVALVWLFPPAIIVISRQRQRGDVTSGK